MSPMSPMSPMTETATMHDHDPRSHPRPTRGRGGVARPAIVGGILGVFVFTPFLFFIPVVGSLVGALIGTFIGAYVGELSAEGASKRGSVRPATGATIGRVLGTMGKMGTAVVVWVALSASAFLP